MTSRSSGLHSDGSPRKCGSADPVMGGLLGERNSHSRAYAWYEVVGPLAAPVQTMVAAYSCRSCTFCLSFILEKLVGRGAPALTNCNTDQTKTHKSNPMAGEIHLATFINPNRSGLLVLVPQPVPQRVLH